VILQNDTANYIQLVMEQQHMLWRQKVQTLQLLASVTMTFCVMCYIVY